MKKVVSSLLLSLLVGFVTFVVSLVPLIMVKMTGPEGGPAWVDTAFTVFLVLVVGLSFVFFFRRKK